MNRKETNNMKGHRTGFPVPPVVAILVCVAAFAEPAAAQNIDEKVAVCALIEVPIARLACYDAVSGRSIEPPDAGVGATEGPAPSAWDVTDDLSPLDRSRRVILIKPSRTLGGPLGSNVAAIGLRCMENTTSIAVSIPEYLRSSGGGPRVQYRIGDMQPVTDQWSPSRDRNVLFGPTGGNAISFIRRMVAADDLVFRVIQSDGAVHEYEFDLPGLNDHVGLLADACHWPADVTAPADLVPPAR